MLKVPKDFSCCHTVLSNPSFGMLTTKKSPIDHHGGPCFTVSIFFSLRVFGCNFFSWGDSGWNLFLNTHQWSTFTALRDIFE